MLDTANPGGFAAGSIDADQFAWLEEQLKARSRRYIDRAGKAVTSSVREQLIVIASHHTCAAMNNPFPGLKPQTERFRGPQVEALLHRFPNVVLHVAGHDLAYRITPKPDAERRTKGYWEITTGSPLDFPMQSRLVEIVANGDGTLSIFSTLYDSAAPVNSFCWPAWPGRWRRTTRNASRALTGRRRVTVTRSCYWRPRSTSTSPNRARRRRYQARDACHAERCWGSAVGKCRKGASREAPLQLAFASSDQRPRRRSSVAPPPITTTAAAMAPPMITKVVVSEPPLSSLGVLLPTD